MIEPLKPGQNWPPEADADRIGKYTKHAQIVDGDHIGAFSDQADLDRYGVYITCNLPELIVKRSTDLLFGEEISLQFEDDAPKDKVEALEDWWYDADMGRVLYEGALDGASLGDAIYLPYRDEDGDVWVEAGQVRTWFPLLDPDNVRKVHGHRLAWERSWISPDGKKIDFLKVKLHEKGKITNELWETKTGKLVSSHGPGTRPWKDLWGDTPQYEDTGIEDDFLLVHVPNYRHAREYPGRSDFFGKDSLFSCLNARYSQMDYLFAYHADPILARVPKGLVDPATGELDKKKLDYIEQGTDPDEPSPEYITWEGNAQEMLAFIEEVTNKILLLTETDRALLGLDGGAGPASGRAIKFALMATLAKVNRKRAYYSRAIPKILTLAQRLWGEKDPVYPTVLWPDGLPQDTLELLDEMDRRLSNGTISKIEAVKRMDDVDKQVAQKMLDEIDEEGYKDQEALTKTIQGRERPMIPKPNEAEVLGELE